MRFVAGMVLLAVLIAGCTAEAEKSACVEPYIPFGFKEGCCLDENLDGVCDIYEEAEEKTERELRLPPPVENGTDSTTTEVPAEEIIIEEPSIIDHYRERYERRVRQMGYRLDSRFGDMHVLIGPQTGRFVTEGALFGIADHRVVVPSRWEHTMHDEWFYEDIRTKQIKVLNYIEWDPQTREHHGCFVEQGSYRLDRCIRSGGQPLVYYGVEFEAPVTPLDLLERYDGQEPVRIDEDRVHLDHDGSRYEVDHLHFLNEDGTTTRLAVHRVFGVPLEARTFHPDGTLKEKLIFEQPAFNSEALRRFELLRRDYTE